MTSITKTHVMCYLVCQKVHIKDPLLLITQHHINVLSVSLNKTFPFFIMAYHLPNSASSILDISRRLKNKGNVCTGILSAPD